MKFEISTPLLQTVCSKLVKAVSSKDIIPSLKNFLISAEGNEIKIIAGDGATYLEKYINSNSILEGGKTSVDGKDFTKLISKINTDTVVIETTNDNKLRINAGKSKFHLKTIDANEYVYPESLVPDVNDIEVNLLELKKALKLASITVSKNATEIYFTGYKIGKALMTTNRNNLTIYNIPISLDDLLLTQDIVNLIYDLDGETATISYTLDFIEIKTLGTRVLGNLLSGLEYFPGNDIMEQFNYDKHVVINKKELLPVLDRAMIFVKDLGAIQLKFENNVVKCSLLGTQDADTYEEISYIGNLDMSVNLNVGMLYNICSSLDSEQIEMQLDSPEYPVVIKSGNYSCLMATMIVD